jgi:glutathione S-transferase
MLELYHSPVSTCSQKVRLVLAQKELDWKSHVIRFDAGDRLSPEYLKLNPNGVVSTLIDDGDPVIDSSVINEYFEDVYPEISLRPKNPKIAARMRAWRKNIDEVPTAAIRPPSFNAFIVPRWSHMTDAEFLDYTGWLPLRKFHRKMGRPVFSNADIEEALDKLQQSLMRMEHSLADGPWLIGDQYTLADVSITSTIARMEDINLSHMWRNLPRVADWYARIKSKPNFHLANMPGSRELVTSW